MLILLYDLLGRLQEASFALSRRAEDRPRRVEPYPPLFMGPGPPGPRALKKD